MSSDGRVATAGGRLVKNVTGYDIPRLATGSLGALGLIARLCLKLWPLPVASATVAVESAEEAVSCAFRPLAVLETEERTSVFLGGTPEEIEGQANALGGTPVDGLDWPQPPPGKIRFSVRVPPSHLRSMVGRLREGWRYVAQFGVGEMAVGADRVGHETLEGLRAAAESVGGALVVIDAPDDLRQRFDPWGTPPASLAIQRRLVNLFDPGRHAESRRPAREDLSGLGNGTRPPTRRSRIVCSVRVVSPQLSHLPADRPGNRPPPGAASQPCLRSRQGDRSTLASPR